MALLAGCSLVWDADDHRGGEGSGGSGNIGGTFLDASAGSSGEASATGGTAGQGDASSDAPADAISCEGGLGDCTPAIAGCETDLLTNAANCGACGRDCMGTNCVAGQCEPQLLGKFAGSFGANAFGALLNLSGNKLYAVKFATAANGGDVYLVDNPSTATPGTMTAVGASEDSAIDVLPLSNGLVFTATSGFYGFSAGPSKPVLTGPTWGLHRDGAEVVVAHSDQVHVFSATDLDTFLSGGAASATSTLPAPKALDVTRSNGVTCWTSTELSEVQCSSWGKPLKLTEKPYAITADAQRVYWTDQVMVGSTNRGASSAVLSTTAPTQNRLITGGIAGRGLAVDGDELFAAVWLASDGEIQRVKTTGGTPVTLVSGLKEPFGVVVDATFVYFSTQDSVYRLRR